MTEAVQARSWLQRFEPLREPVQAAVDCGSDLMTRVRQRLPGLNGFLIMLDCEMMWVVSQVALKNLRFVIAPVPFKESIVARVQFLQVALLATVFTIMQFTLALLTTLVVIGTRGANDAVNYQYKKFWAHGGLGLLGIKTAIVGCFSPKGGVIAAAAVYGSSFALVAWIYARNHPNASMNDLVQDVRDVFQEHQPRLVRSFEQLVPANHRRQLHQLFRGMGDAQTFGDIGRSVLNMGRGAVTDFVARTAVQTILPQHPEIRNEVLDLVQGNPHVENLITQAVQHHRDPVQMRRAMSTGLSGLLQDPITMGRIQNLLQNPQVQTLIRQSIPSNANPETRHTIETILATRDLTELTGRLRQH